MALSLGLGGVAGCGSPQPDETTPPAAVSPAPTGSASPTPSLPTTASPTALPSESASGTDTSEAEQTSEAGDDESERPPVLDQDATGRDLTKSDFFSAPDAWQDGRFDVAGKRGLSGISGPLDSCQQDQSDHETLELRLANRFKKISMKVGQSDESEQSDAVLNVRLLGNGKYIDSVKVPFNEVSDFSAPVSDVNALKFEVWIGGDKCSGGEVGAVINGLRLE